MTTTNKLAAALATATIATLSNLAVAAPLLPGPTSTAAVINENNPVGGTVLSSLPATFATANYTGTLTSTVIQGDTSNPYGGLTFTYQLTNDVPSLNAIQRIIIPGFSGYATDVSYKFGTGTVAPSKVDRVNAGSIGWAFNGDGLGVIAPGATTELLVIQTNALSFFSPQANITNGAISSVSTFAPAGAITPEPATLVGLAGAGLVLGRRRRA